VVDNLSEFTELDKTISETITTLMKQGNQCFDSTLLIKIFGLVNTSRGINDEANISTR
jgi:hypothetical protein